MEDSLPEDLVTLPPEGPLWERFFTVAPLVLIGTREASGEWDFAPKHMASPLSWENYFGFVCTPRHGTYHNAKREGVFTVTYPRPSQVLLASLAASGRGDDNTKPGLRALPTFAAREIEGAFVRDGYLFLECRLDRIVDGFGSNSLVTGQIVAAHVQQQAIRASERDDSDLIHQNGLLAYLHPGRFARIAESYSFPFHVDFQR